MTDLKVGDRVVVIAKGPWQCRQGVVNYIYDDGMVAVLLDGGDLMWLRRSQVARLTEPPK